MRPGRAICWVDLLRWSEMKVIRFSVRQEKYGECSFGLQTLIRKRVEVMVRGYRQGSRGQSIACGRLARLGAGLFGVVARPAPALVLLVLLVAVAAPTAGVAAADTVLGSVRFGLHPRHTRLVFDAEGPEPRQIDRGHAGETRVLFDHLRTGIKTKNYGKAGSLISRLRVEQVESGWMAVISHRAKDVQVKTEILPADPPKPGAYRLVLDFYRGPADSRMAAQAPGSRPPGSTSLAAVEKLQTASVPAANSAAVAAPLPSSVAAPAAPPLSEQIPGEGKGQALASSLAVALPGASLPAPVETANPDEGPYREANAYFDAHQNELAVHGTAIIDRYKAALTAAPNHPDQPLALYRCGVLAASMGGLIMAEGYLRRLISAHPDHPLVGPAWLRIAKGKHRMGQYAEAIRAFQSALKGNLDPGQRLEAQYFVGAGLTMAGDHQQAIAALEQCLAEDPKYYLKQPEILLNLGESYFAGKDYANSIKVLFRYLNLGVPEPKNQNLVLARLAESLQQQGESRLSGRLYGYVQSYLPNSDGDIISRIREAERLEQKGGMGLQSALAVYEELARRNLPENLMRLIKFRLASNYGRLGETEKGLHIVQEVMDANPGSTTLDEFYPLQRDLLKDLINKAFIAGNYLEVATLDQNHHDLLHMETDPQLDPIIARGYEQLKLYPNAVSLYQSLIRDDPRHRDTWNLKAAGCSLEMRDLSSALGYCDAVRDTSLDREKTGILARVHFARRQYAEASTQFAKFFKGQKDLAKLDWQMLIDYVSCLMALGRHQEALVYLQKASEHPAAGEGRHHLDLCLLLGQCYEARNLPKEALPFLEEALQLIPEKDAKDYVIYKIARLHKSIGQIDQAKDMFTQLLGSGQSLWQAVAREELNDITIARAAL